MPASNGRNVLLICMDHWPGHLIHGRGCQEIQTPTLDRLAACGVSFQRAYSPTPVCVPARRELMTGMTARSHGDRTFDQQKLLPEVTTLAQAFRNYGYQAVGVGKLHAAPQRNRIGFDDVILNEEGRRLQFPNGMREDDYARFIHRAGLGGEEYLHAMSTNDYLVRPWHLEEKYHQTNWTAREMCEQILRRDPTRPAFWYCGFTAPHPPLVPPLDFLRMYEGEDIPLPRAGEWSQAKENPPYAVQFYQSMWNIKSPKEQRDALRGFYATCTQVDYGIRTIIGTLAEEKLLANTIIAITSDHGDMLGCHGLWAKNLFYEGACHIPFMIIPPEDSEVFPCATMDNRLVELRDMMPTLLDMCGLDIPPSVEGMALTRREESRDHIYGELWEDVRATRMLLTEKYKLIYYATGNRQQLFDMEADPLELEDLSARPGYQGVLNRLTDQLAAHLYGSDALWLREGELVGAADQAFAFRKHYANCNAHMQRTGLLNQRGLR